MSDNIVLNPETGIRDTSSFATDEIGGIHHQYVKLEFGPADTAIPVSTTNPIPVTAGDIATALTVGRQVVSTPGTVVSLSSSLACKWVTATALTTNTGVIWIGNTSASGVLHSEFGIPLAAGDGITIPVDNVSKVCIDATVAAEGVTFLVGS